MIDISIQALDFQAYLYITDANSYNTFYEAILHSSDAKSKVGLCFWQGNHAYIEGRYLLALNCYFNCVEEGEAIEVFWHMIGFCLRKLGHPDLGSALIFGRPDAREHFNPAALPKALRNKRPTATG